MDMELVDMWLRSDGKLRRCSRCSKDAVDCACVPTESDHAMLASLLDGAVLGLGCAVQQKMMAPPRGPETLVEWLLWFGGITARKTEFSLPCVFGSWFDSLRKEANPDKLMFVMVIDILLPMIRKSDRECRATAKALRSSGGN